MKQGPQVPNVPPVRRRSVHIPQAMLQVAEHAGPACTPAPLASSCVSEVRTSQGLRLADGCARGAQQALAAPRRRRRRANE